MVDQSKRRGSEVLPAKQPTSATAGRFMQRSRASYSRHVIRSCSNPPSTPVIARGARLSPYPWFQTSSVRSEGV